MRHALLLPALLISLAPADAAAQVPFKARRFIAVLKPTATSCPAVQAGQVQLLRAALFPTAKTHRMGRYCVYAHPQGVLMPAPEHPAFLRVDPDLDVLLPQAEALASNPDYRRALTDAHLASLGGSFGGPHAQSIYTTAQGLPRLAIVDTADQRGEYDGSGARKHGLAMGMLAEQIRCPAPIPMNPPSSSAVKCRALTSFVQAFPNASNAVDRLRWPALDVPNHTLGSLGTVAQAVVTTLPASPNTPVVINLSLGWEGEVAGRIYRLAEDQHSTLRNAPSTDIPAPVQAAHAALLYASCRGALVIAAAGNNLGGACEQTGPLEPAAWESFPAPNASQCAAILSPVQPVVPPDPTGPTPGPLLYAAGGILDDGAPLPISRVGGTPPRVAPSFMAVAAGRTDPWTGTSVSAAVLSGLAAAVWTYEPTWTAHQVIAWIDGANLRSGPTIDFASPIADQRAVRLSGSRTRNRLCSVAPQVPGCHQSSGTLADGGEQLAAVLTAVQASTPDITSIPHRPRHVHRKSRCGSAVTTTSYANTTEAANPPGPPLPWARPQPPTPICPACPIRSSKLMLFLNAEQQGNFPQDPPGTLKLWSPTLEFLIDGKYGRVILPNMTIAGPREIELAPYALSFGKFQMTMAAALAQVSTGTLTVLVKDASGALVTAESVVQVVP